MRRFNVIPATKEHVEQITGDALPYTSYIFEVLHRNDTLGFIGTYRRHSYKMLYAWIDPDIELKRYRRGVILAYRKVMTLLEAQSFPVYSYADEEREGSDRLLEHIGFHQYQGRLYRWLGSPTH